MNTDRQLEELLQESIQQPHPCLLCDRLTHSRATFKPNGEANQAEFKTPNGKTRIFIYALCEFCASTQKKFEQVVLQVEEILMAGVQPGVDSGH